MEVSAYADKVQTKRLNFLWHVQFFELQMLCCRFKENMDKAEHENLCSQFLEDAPKKKNHVGCCFRMIKEHNAVCILCFSANVFEVTWLCVDCRCKQ